MRIPYISMLAAGALALGGCAYGDLGLGMGDYGYGYSPYGYGSSIGIGYGSYYGSGYYPYGGYGGYGYGGYGGYGYSMPYYGWYDNSYYPGVGTYVYDSYRQPHIMTTTQRQYWSSRSPALRTTTTTRTRVQPNWSGFDRRATSTDRQQRRIERQQRWRTSG